MVLRLRVQASVFKFRFGLQGCEFEDFVGRRAGELGGKTLKLGDKRSRPNNALCYYEGLGFRVWVMMMMMILMMMVMAVVTVIMAVVRW